MFRDDVVEALQERLELLLDGAGHLHLAHEADVLHLVLLRDLDVASARLQVPNLVDAKFLDVGAEGEFVAHFRDVVFDQVHQACREEKGVSWVPRLAMRTKGIIDVSGFFLGNVRCPIERRNKLFDGKEDPNEYLQLE